MEPWCIQGESSASVLIVHFILHCNNVGRSVRDAEETTREWMTIMNKERVWFSPFGKMNFTIVGREYYG